MAGKIFDQQFEESVALSYREILDRTNGVMQHLNQPPPVIPGGAAPPSTPMNELRRNLLRDGAALSVARHLLVNRLEQLGLLRADAINSMGELAMAALKKVTDAQKKPNIIQ